MEFSPSLNMVLLPCFLFQGMAMPSIQLFKNLELSLLPPNSQWIAEPTSPPKYCRSLYFHPSCQQFHRLSIIFSHGNYSSRHLPDLLTSLHGSSLIHSLNPTRASLRLPKCDNKYQTFSDDTGTRIKDSPLTCSCWPHQTHSPPHPPVLTLCPTLPPYLPLSLVSPTFYSPPLLQVLPHSFTLDRVSPMGSLSSECLLH